MNPIRTPANVLEIRLLGLAWLMLTGAVACLLYDNCASLIRDMTTNETKISYGALILCIAFVVYPMLSYGMWLYTDAQRNPTLWRAEKNRTASWLYDLGRDRS